MIQFLISQITLYFALNDLPITTQPKNWQLDKTTNKLIGCYSEKPLAFANSDYIISGDDDHSVTFDSPEYANKSLLVRLRVYK
jgi:hypothetical protein